MLRRLYDRTMALAAHPHALWWLFGIAFIESSFFPIPPHALLLPMILAAPTRAWTIAAACTTGSVLGGYLGYAIGYFLFDAIGQQVIHFYHAEEKFAAFSEQYNQWGAWIVAFFGFTPFPYKVITIASGMTQLNLLTFGLASLASRGAVFFMIAALLKYYGPPIREFIEKRLGLVSLAGFGLVIGGFLALKYI